MNETEFANRIVSTMESLGIPYFITGSIASIELGVPRYTNDIDVVADILLTAVSKILAEFPAPEFYVSESAARDAVTIAMSPAQVNRDVYNMLKDGVTFAFPNEDGAKTDETVRVIDWDRSDNNEFFLASQFWISSPNSIYKRRADLIVLINELPLVFIELKKSHRKIEQAYKHNLKDYREAIEKRMLAPQGCWNTCVGSTRRSRTL